MPGARCRDARGVPALPSPAVPPGLLRAGGSVLELERMIRAATGRSALLSYSWYGCFCGIGGSGSPVDATDR